MIINIARIMLLRRSMCACTKWCAKLLSNNAWPI